MSVTSYYIYEPSNGSVFPDFDRLFNAAFDARTSANKEAVSNAGGTRGFRPRMDLHESKDKKEMIATFELPGMKKEEIFIDVHNQRLIVSGQTTQKEEVDKEGYVVQERRQGRFERVIPLPSGIKPQDVKASMDNGVLTINFPNSNPEQEPKRIAIS